MVDNKQATDSDDLPSFKALNEFERRAVILRSEGKPYDVIANHINVTYALTYQERTIREWFNAGGRLEQAYSEYNEAQALLSLKEARQVIRKAQKVAAANMIKKIGSSDETISLRASAMLLNKYIPDKQVVLDKPEAEADMPAELLDAANAAKEADDGSQGLDEPPVGSPDPAEAG